MEFYNFSDKDAKVVAGKNDNRILFKLFILISSFSFILNVHLVIIGLQTNKRLAEYKVSLDKRKYATKDLEICKANLHLQEILVGECKSKLKK